MQQEPPKYEGIGFLEMLIGAAVTFFAIGILISLCLKGS
jgi:hypothetical protein